MSAVVRFHGVGSRAMAWEARVPLPLGRKALLLSLARSGAFPRWTVLDVRWLPGKLGVSGVVVSGGRIVGSFEVVTPQPEHC